MERIVPGLLIAGLWLLLLLFGSVQLFAGVLAVAVLIAADEYLQMAYPQNLNKLERVGLNLVLALPLLALCLLRNPAILAGATTCSFGLLTAFFLYKYKSLDSVYDLFSKLVLGVVYIGLLGSHVLLLRLLPEGASWLIIASAITSCSDSGAYFVGKRFGKKKLCPNISPNKTVEGAVGGVLSGLLAALFFGVILLENPNLIFLVTASVVLGCVGIAGDLTESIIKRGTGTKDSGRCLAGHGGVLDRVDSLLFVAPVLYYLLVFLVV